jgi:hypothetical protein
VLSHKWILEAKQEYGVELRILNNGKRLFFDKLNEESSSNASGENGRKSSVENMLAEAARISREEQGLDVEYTGSISLPKEVYFETADFYACTALIPKGSGVLSLVLVYPLDGLKGQIFHQRILWGGLLLIAVLASLGVGAMNAGLLQERMAGHARDRQQAMQAAEAALRDAEADIRALGERLGGYKQVERVEILPYHTLGVHKYEAMGKEYRLAGVQENTPKQSERAAALFREYFPTVVVN